MAIYNADQIYALARQAGFTQDEATIATAISLAESGGNTSVVNSIGATGLWQIYFGNGQGGSTDPLTNAKQAYAKYIGADKSWCPWAVFDEGSSNGSPCVASGTSQRNNSWRNFLGQAQAASGVVGSGSNPLAGAVSGAGDAASGLGSFAQDVLDGLRKSLGISTPGGVVGNTTHTLLAGPIVISAAILFLILGAYLWNAGTINKTVVKTGTRAAVGAVMP